MVMIEDKNDYLYYLAEDKKALGITKKRPSMIGDEIWVFQRRLRKTEFLLNTSKHSLITKIRYAFSMFLFHRMRVKYGFSIPLNVFGPGLSIAHRGTLVVNGNAKIGKNCRVQECVTIGSTNGQSQAPVIGDNVFIGSGARIIGDIYICSGCQIAAGAVVVKNCDVVGTYGGIPARLISNNDSRMNLNYLSQ